MRMSREAMAANHDRIVDQAARLFREHGIERTSVADVMGAAGMTHGGFYRHFKNKDELVAATIGRAFDAMANRLEQDLGTRGASAAVNGFVERYLSLEHARHPGQGCPLATLGTEVAREASAASQAMEAGTGRLVELLAAGLGTGTKTDRSNAEGLLATLVGALVLARSAHDERAMKAVLTSTRRLAKSIIEQTATA